MLRRIAPLLLLLSVLASCGGNDDSRLTFSGTMETTTVRVSAQTPGILTSVAVDEGARVTRGQSLGVIDTEKLTYQLEQSTAALEEIDRQTRAAGAQLDAAIVNRDNLKTRYERFRALLASQSVTQQAVDDVKAQLDAADDLIRASRTSLTAAASKRAQIQAGMKTVRKQVRDATVESPLDGVVLVRYAEAGELVGIGTPLYEIADLNELWTRIYIDEPLLPRAHIGQRATITADGMPNRTFTGTVTWISDKSEFTPKTILTQETRTTLVFPAKVSIPNAEGILKIGMPVSVTLER